jgi:hypothetical protein
MNQNLSKKEKVSPSGAKNVRKPSNTQGTKAFSKAVPGINFENAW